ncbi:hypothetical protein BVU17_00585 [Haloarcula taiwanensis]|uniref:DUF4382 domain-containing protein n=1 Tax=Haloarcula taiwanensis TaxID=1932004 RepID=A0A2H5A259_9EURY|nr:hypothetical protein BVU17_00585 [Haloarcula taiwanensis]RLM40381.1 DUF4382 domain-containing protein [Haloarcula sp. Atlit-120R]RLM48399.1 DUF4382 domain-containing protein [Haloarcula sp. Atlit-47R]
MATGAGVGVGLLAGCSGSSDSGGSDGTSGDGTSAGGSTDEDAMTDDGGTVGTFRLLISDQPAAIGDFDSLDVSFSKARIFRAKDSEETDERADATKTEATEAATAEATETETAESTEMDTADDDAEDEAEDGEDMDEEADEDEGGFEVRDLDGATVDLTEVVGDKAIGVLDGELEAGRYSKIELYAESVDGVVDGESVDVKIPSEKLQLTKPFEVVAGESVEFVFDINVVKKGTGGYNLLPVISESGVAGKDVEIEEVDSNSVEDAADDEKENSDDTADDEETERDSMTDSDRGGNETTTAE